MLQLLARAAPAQESSGPGAVAPVAAPAAAAEPEAAPAEPPPADVTPPAPAAGPPDGGSEARQRFDRGVRLYQEGEFEVALAEFERAYELMPNVHVLYNIGQLCFQLHKFARARDALGRYLAQGQGELPPERVQAVQRDLAALELRTAILRIRVNVPEAQVFIDAAPARVASADGFIIDAGERSVRVSKAGYLSYEKHPNVAGGDRLDWLVQLEPVPAAGPVVLPAAPLPRPAERSALQSWVPWAITGALAAGWATAGVITLRAQSHKKELERDKAAPEAELSDAASTLETWAVVSDVLLVSTLASAGVSTYFSFFAGPSTPSAMPAVGAGAGVSSGRRPLGARGWGAGVAGTFW